MAEEKHGFLERGRRRSGVASRILGWTALLAVVGLAAACGGGDSEPSAGDGGTQEAQSGGDGAGPDQVSVRLGWIQKEEYAFLYSGVEKGFFAENGIDLVINLGEGSLSSMELVNRGADEFGYTGGPSFFIAAAEGMDLKMLALMLQKNPSNLLSWPDTPVNDLQDLEGKRFLLTVGDAFSALWPSVAADAGIDRSKIDERNVGQSSQLQAFVAHRGDVTPSFATSSHSQLEEAAGVEFNVVNVADLGYNIVSNGIFTRTELIEENPDLVRRFVAAAVKSWDWTAENVEEASEIMSEHLSDVELDSIVETVRATTELAHTENTVGEPTGWMAREDWESSLDLMKKGGLLEGEVNIDEMYTNDFLPESK
ncbi:MAG: ABC transporter substrate-binding protein [Gaiellaceae bacterium]